MSQALVIPKVSLETLRPKRLADNISTFEDSLGLFSIETCLQPRSTCETDDRFVQVIPYIALMNEFDQVFSYRRGNASGERRLLNSCSLGLGGHVEESISSIHNRIDKMSSLLTLHTLRELNEEIGYAISYDNYNIIYDKFSRGNFQLIYSTMNNVDKYHLCLFIILYIDEASYFAHLPEKDVINEGDWLTVKDLINKHETGERKLEGWSEIILYNYLQLPY